MVTEVQLKQKSSEIRARVNHPIVDTDGHEADDAVTAWAFNSRANPFGSRLRATLGSDLGHWDVNDAQEVVAEAYELVERGLMSDEDFRDFTFTNPVTFCAGLNRSFFENTAVEAHAAALLKDSE